MILRTDSKYPIHRSYVVKLSRDATPDALCGRIENLVAGTHHDFTSARELLDLIANDIASPYTESPDKP
jgi:hypothetical protein